MCPRMGTQYVPAAENRLLAAAAVSSEAAHELIYEFNFSFESIFLVESNLK